MINDPNEIIARLYPVDAGSGGGGGGGTGQNLTILQPNGQSAVYNGSAEVTADARPKTLTIKSPDGSTATYDGSAATTANVKIGKLVLKTPSGDTPEYTGAGMTMIAIGSGTNGAIGAADLGAKAVDFSALDDALRVAARYGEELTGTLYNVQDYGVTGNGTTDDGWAIQACIDQARVNAATTSSTADRDADVTRVTRPVIYFPAGTYNITRTLFYYSSMTFVFAPGAMVRKGVNVVGDPNTRLTTCIFAPYFDPRIGVWSSGDGTFDGGQRFGVRDVKFLGGKISGYNYNGSGVDAQPSAIVFLLTLCKDIDIIGMEIDGNQGGHSFEINSSTHVRIRNCVFKNIIQTGSGNGYENVQIDAATCNATASVLIAEAHTGTAPDGRNHGTWYTYTSGGSYKYRMTGGYYDFTMLPPGDQFTAPSSQTDYALIIAKMGCTTKAQVNAQEGFRQCCHDIEISNCYFRNDNGTSCTVSAIGSHTDFRKPQPTEQAPDPAGENYADPEHDMHTDIKILDNVFYWPMSRADGSNYRGVITFGAANVDPRVKTCTIRGNVFHGTGASSDVAITAYKATGPRKVDPATGAVSEPMTRFSAENATYCPQRDYRIFENTYHNITGWETAGTLPNDEIEKIYYGTESSNAYLTMDAGSLSSCRIWKWRGMIHAHMTVTNVSIAASDKGIKRIAIINQPFRPYAPRVDMKVNAPIAAYITDANGYYPATGYISYGANTSTLTIITGFIGTATQLVIDYFYPVQI